jgi:hypothetical protein
MRRVIFTLEGPEGRLDRLVFEAGATLVDSSSMKKYAPIVTVSQVLAVRVEDDEAATTFDPVAFCETISPALLDVLHDEIHRRNAVAEQAKAERRRLTSYFPDNDPPKE